MFMNHHVKFLFAFESESLAHICTLHLRYSPAFCLDSQMALNIFHRLLEEITIKKWTFRMDLVKFKNVFC